MQDCTTEYPVLSLGKEGSKLPPKTKSCINVLPIKEHFIIVEDLRKQAQHGVAVNVASFYSLIWVAAFKNRHHRYHQQHVFKLDAPQKKFLHVPLFHRKQWEKCQQFYARTHLRHHLPRTSASSEEHKQHVGDEGESHCRQGAPGDGSPSIL